MAQENLRRGVTGEPWLGSRARRSGRGQGWGRRGSEGPPQRPHPVRAGSGMSKGTAARMTRYV
eukprot:1847758-Amphidinium_carterae.1